MKACDSPLRVALAAGVFFATLSCTSAPRPTAGVSRSAGTAGKPIPASPPAAGNSAGAQGLLRSHGAALEFDIQPGTKIPTIEARYSLRNVTSRPLSQIARAPGPPPDAPLEKGEMEKGPDAYRTIPPRKPDPVLQSHAGATMPPPIQNFEGVPNVNGVQPADTTFAIGPNHVFQWVNLAFQVFDKSGNTLAGPFNGNTLFTELGGDCAAINGGDILALYDQFADRWILTQLAPAIFGANGNHQCIAVSTSGDPLGSYYLYDYLYGDALNDYPKFGMWPDAYYMTAREFGGEGGFTMTVTAFDRTAMLNGLPFTAIFVSLNDGTFDGLLPADLDGPNPPPGTVLNPDGTAAFAPDQIFLGVDPPGVAGPEAVIHMYRMHPDFATPANSTFTGPFDFPIADYNPVPFFDPVPQPEGGGIESLGWILYRLPYRNFGTHESLVLYHDVKDEAGRVIPRWYEFRDPYGEPIVYQQSTYGPDDGVYRWMGSLAMDGNGNLAVGFSVSDDTSTHAGIRYAGRLATDPLNELTHGETELIAGSGSFQGVRWGDYSTMDVDPVDDCTFWYTQMYIGVPGISNWQTRVGSFKFPSCFAPGYGTVEGTVSDGVNPLAGVHIGVTGSIGGGGSNTDASGHYEFDLPAGTYSLTAAKYGYTPVAQPGVVIGVGANTTQDFVLDAAPSETVSGTVTDGSGGNWPLYARIVITAPGAPVFTVFTDPVTGQYTIPLVTGNTFRFAVTAVSSGYALGGGLLPLAPAGGGGVVANWALTVNSTTCDAPGYSRTGLSESFDAGVVPPGWSLVTNSGGPWSVVSEDPCGTFDNTTGGSGPFAVANSSCDGEVFDDNELHTPPVNMSGFATTAVAFNSSFFAGSFNVADVDVSTDGGSSWTNVFRLDGVNEPGPIRHTIDITGLAAGQPDVRARFHFYNAFASGWWQVDDAFLGDPTCLAGPGGLVVGNVLDDNTDLGLNGATVAHLPQPAGDSTKSFATPDDPAQPDGMYILYADAGSQSFMASLDPYTPQTESTIVIAQDATRLDFHLAAGRLDASPRPLSARVDPGQTAQQTLDIINSGAADAGFELVELDVPPPFPPAAAAGRFADPAAVREALRRIPSGRLHGRSSAGLPPLPATPTGSTPLAGGNVLNAYPTQLVAGWGVAFDTDAGDFWVSNSGAAGGDDLEYRYLTDGTQTGDTIDDSSWVEEFAADGAFNARTGMLWRVNVGGDNCLYELDPFLRAPTGNKICVLPWAGISQRGLAYDVLSDTYYVGGWNEGVIYHIDGTGAILDSTSVSIPISGLAYNSRTGHLFALTNHGPPPFATFDVFVFDAKNGMTVIGAFNVTQDGQPVPGLLANGGAGMEIDCAGHLWLVDQANQLLFEVASGEINVCAFNDIPWLSESITQGTVPATTTLPIVCTFDSAGLSPGLRQGQLKILTDTPYRVSAVPVDLTVRFLDVADSNIFEAFIYAAAGAGIMPGCDVPAFLFCPTDLVTRADMAGFILRAVHGAEFVPVPYAGAFADVSAGDYNADYIQSFFEEGYTAGCGGGNFCPDAVHTRGQTAVFILKGIHGTGYVPPGCGTTHVFDDVPCPATPEAPFGDWIGQLFVEGITAGCGGNNFCPGAGIPNQQMAAFLVRAVQIPHL